MIFHIALTCLVLHGQVNAQLGLGSILGGVGGQSGGGGLLSSLPTKQLTDSLTGGGQSSGGLLGSLPTKQLTDSLTGGGVLDSLPTKQVTDSLTGNGLLGSLPTKQVTDSLSGATGGTLDNVPVVGNNDRNNDENTERRSSESNVERRPNQSASSASTGSSNQNIETVKNVTSIEPVSESSSGLELDLLKLKTPSKETIQELTKSERKVLNQISANGSTDTTETIEEVSST